MVAVNTFDGIAYGFRVMGYLFFVIIIAVGVGWVGAELVGSGQDGLNADSDQVGPVGDVGNFVDVAQVLVGAVLGLVGALIAWAGLIGTTYKVIADAVERGNEASS
jgi:hypothetical protein